ncbi:MAG: ABC transporter ATP-binding protein [Verrucomicrobiota bacterium]
MSRPIIEVRNLSKVYQLGSIGANSLRNECALLWEKLRGRHERQKKGEFWALREVGFEVQPGEVVGIIGRNGAGKSTLLKILSRITQQTTGEIVLRGRVASLLEVGTGFHPDLTGRENIFLNGAILGMTKAEIRRKLDEIIAFAEVERFVDTPVKRYSSGMYVRLAFAVAAHLEPEILIVDEVLAVGDAAFQKKCLGKMGEVSRREGRTVLFVSHNMAALRALCSRASLLESGRSVVDGDVRDAVSAYVDRMPSSPAVLEWSDAEAPSQRGVVLRKASVLNQLGKPAATLANNEPFSISIEYETNRKVGGLRIGFFMQNSEGVDICASNDVHALEPELRVAGRFITRCDFPANLLNEGSYQLRFTAEGEYEAVNIQTAFCMSFAVEDVVRHGESKHRLPGVLRPLVTWSLRPQG